eukprot:13082268-Heterocapsa_arctica.AAC.1
MRRMPGQDLTGFHKVLLNPCNKGRSKPTFSGSTVNTANGEKGRERRRREGDREKSRKGGANTSSQPQ